jgi:iron(III) transport system permease protein
MARKLTLLTAVLMFMAIGLAPVVSMFVKTLFVNGQFTLKNYGLLFQSKREWMLLYNSLSLASATTAATVLPGVPLGLLLTKTDLPLKRIFTMLFLVPLIIPPYILAIAWFHCLGRSGIAANILGPEIGIHASPLLFGFPGALLVMASTLLPVVIILTMTYLRMVNPRLEEAARLSASWPVVFRRISLPVIRPGILLAGLMVFILTLGEFGAPSFLRFEVFPVESFTRFSAFYDFDSATAAAMPLGAIVLIVLTAERIFLRKKTFQFAPAGGPLAIAPLGKTKPFFLTMVSLLAIIFVLVPLGVLLFKSSSPWAYREALARSKDSILRSLTYASLGATGIVVFGFFLGYLLERRVFRFFYAVDSMLLFLFALPGAVIGIGLIHLWNTPATNFVYASTAIIMFGYIAQYTALGERIMAAQFSRIPNSMEEAARIAGAGWFRRLFYVLVPMAKRGMAAAWLVGFIFCLRDLGIAMTVYPPGHDTLPVRIFTLMANGPEEVVAASCVILAAIALLPLGALMAAARYIRWP